jgi:DNA-binding MarR family transcriptional regulator
MRPTSADVEHMIAPLMSISAGVQQAWRGRTAASTLMLLRTVAANERMRPSDLATLIGVHLSSITRQLRTLEDSGFVTLTADPDDRRSCFVTLTEAGIAEHQRLMHVGFERFADFVDGWDAADVRRLGDLLSKLDESMAERNQARQVEGGRRWQRQ